MRKVLGVYGSPQPDRVGEGIPVRSLFSQASYREHVSPFLLLDYAGPTELAPADKPRGVDVHPHRGFETVTIVYRGEVEHRDSTGQGGLIGPGDVQWMTAASDILHQEFQSHAFTKKGGTLETVQLWVNLPAKSDYSRIINARAVDRLASLIEPTKVIAGGKSDPEAHYLDPTLLYPITWDDKIMADEIFGPILPILTYKSFD
ncbi:MAG TPA: aldehyde dehydrogenase family protein, partial [Steroidobacteraceae bacterium]